MVQEKLIIGNNFVLKKFKNTAIILFVFGSGPIKGFSITLSLGILASMFTAIIFTNFLIHVWYSFSKKKEIIL